MKNPLKINIITLFPELFDALNYGITRRAIERGIIETALLNPRDFTTDKYKTVDDRPYGGGPGMLMKVKPLQKAIHAARAKTPNTRVIYVSPQGKRFDQTAACDMAKCSSLTFVSGRYEGIDERLIESEIDEEWSIGDYVLSGGELPVLVMIDAITRLLPGALGDADSAEQDSFMNGLLDCPHYTRPEEINGLKVPAVLLGGHHAEITQWRLKQALGRTWQRRPDLLEKLKLTSEQKRLLAEFMEENP